MHQFAEPLAILLVQLVQATRYSCISAKEVDEYNDGNYETMKVNTKMISEENPPLQPGDRVQ